MTWNYRVVRYRNGEGYGLHEVYYDAAGQPWAMTEKPATFCAHIEDDAQCDISNSLERAMNDVVRLPIFDEPEEWPGQPTTLGHSATQ